MRVSYVYRGRVVKAERRDRLVRGWKDAEGEVKYEYEDLGWYLSIDCFPLIAFPLGNERPDPLPEIGSKVEVVLRFPPDPIESPVEGAKRPPPSEEVQLQVTTIAERVG